MKIIKRNSENKPEINIETYLKKRKLKKENMGITDILICLKKRNKNKKNIKKNIKKIIVK